MPTKKTPASTDAAKPRKRATRKKAPSADELAATAAAADISAASAASAPTEAPASIPATPAVGEVSDLDSPIRYSIPEATPAEDKALNAEELAEKAEADSEKAEEHVAETAAASAASANTFGAAGAMSDIKPKPAAVTPLEAPTPKAADLPKRPVASRADTSFLRSENNGFGLKEHVESGSSWITKVAYVLGALIILMVIALAGITYYTNHLKNQSTAQTADQSTDGIINDGTTDQAPAVTTPATLNFTIVGPAADYIAKLSSTITAQDKTLTYDKNAQPNLPALKADTLLFKSEAKDKAALLANNLSSYGIKVQLQESTDIADEMVIYLTPTVQNPNLSGNTSTVYNATGKTGAAKTYCDDLKKDMVESCTALNFTGKTIPTGLQIYSKNPAVYFVLKRTTAFQNATFNSADSGQVEDIKVVIGK